MPPPHLYVSPKHQNPSESLTLVASAAGVWNLKLNDECLGFLFVVEEFVFVLAKVLKKAENFKTRPKGLLDPKNWFEWQNSQVEKM